MTAARAAFGLRGSRRSTWPTRACASSATRATSHGSWLAGCARTQRSCPSGASLPSSTALTSSTAAAPTLRYDSRSSSGARARASSSLPSWAARTCRLTSATARPTRRRPHGRRATTRASWHRRRARAATTAASGRASSRRPTASSTAAASRGALVRCGSSSRRSRGCRTARCATRRGTCRTSRASCAGTCATARRAAR